MAHVRVLKRASLSLLSAGLAVVASGQFNEWDLASESFMHAQSIDSAFLSAFVPWTVDDTVLYVSDLDWGAGVFSTRTLPGQTLGGLEFRSSTTAVRTAGPVWAWTSMIRAGELDYVATGTVSWLNRADEKEMDIEGVWSDSEMNPLGTAKGKAKVKQQQSSVVSEGTFEVFDKDGKSKGRKSLIDTRVQTEPDPTKEQKYVWYMFAVADDKASASVSAGDETESGATASHGHFYQTIVPEPPAWLLLAPWTLLFARRRKS
ncbi:MAG: hypothetical protein JST30_15805 [Armatimonadetes bacterium]|nr:hypothetical protein [Armatimonadota bacterium]